MASDLSASRFLEEVMLSGTKKIVKLDFKTPDIVANVVDAILKLHLAVSFFGEKTGH